jgi:hypothetical protein
MATAGAWPMPAEPPAAGEAGESKRCRFLQIGELCGWRLKTYGIAGGSRPRPELVAAAMRVTADALPKRPDLEGAFGLGFLIVHDTAACCLALVHWWVRPDELHQRVFETTPDAPRALMPPVTATIGHLPELAIIEHERQALLRHVLDRPAGPDVDAYLTDVLR